MPLYEYICEKCHKSFEHLARAMNSDEKVKCPSCSSTQTARSLSVFAVGAAVAKNSSNEGAGCPRCGSAGPCGM
jgi:putative FmdB family regulatory protein